MSAESLTAELHRVVSRPVEPRGRERAALHLLDWIGTLVAGVWTAEGRALTAWAAGRASGRCHAVGSGRREAPVAAFVNGGLAIALELDDMHLGARLHPSDTVLPAALAAAERASSTPAEFLDAVVRGYEAAIRIGEAVGPGHYRFWHNTSTCGTFGAAAAVTSILHLSDRAAIDALGNAGTQSSGLWQVRPEHAMSKAIHAGRAAESGLLAADLAALGFTGPRRILEGEMGLFAATAPDADADAIRRPGDWKIFETAMKPWASCGHTHAAIDAALSLRPQVAGADVRDVLVKTYPDALSFADCPEPDSSYAAKFSIQHAVALALVGDLSPRSFDVGAVRIPEIAALRNRVRVEVGEPPRGVAADAWGAEVLVTTSEGTSRAVCTTPKGSPQKPLTRDETIAKACELMALGGLDVPRARAIADAALALPSGGTLPALTSLLP